MTSRMGVRPSGAGNGRAGRDRLSLLGLCDQVNTDRFFLEHVYRHLKRRKEKNTNENYRNTPISGAPAEP
ncbi:hypothetical protein [Streptosporangium sp. H16]|uniref:hypothetical protein n=1 Tax=Streptosporangium sp. H16 TaxID=3444184 RepID=UPI003F7A2BF7